MTVSRTVTAESLALFIAATQAMINEYYAAHFAQNAVPTLEIMTGPKFYRVVRVSPGERSVFCFIEKSTGNILKAAGWKGPAKTARGSIYYETL